MAEIILSQAGAAIGANLLPNGIGLFGQTLSGAVLGEAVGRLAGQAIDASLAPVSEGARISALHVMESREGSTLPLVYGRARIGGQVIWASRFNEYRTEQSAGKGGPKYAEYAYSVSFAVALCQGPITRVDRVWANGELVTLSQVNWRLYTGTETQLPDPLIEAIEGAASAPAYRGTAYIVFEDFPLDAYGNHLPQMSFEVVRASQNTADRLSQTVDGVNIIPATGEFVYATSVVSERRFPGIETPLNMNNARGEADFVVSLDQLSQDLPKVSHAALTVAWFGTDLRAGECRIAPGVEVRDRSTVPYSWSASDVGRDDAYLISRTDGRPNYGGTPADLAVIEGIQALKAAGHAVTLSPFLLMDIPTGNGLTDPYGTAEQAASPWRGRITVAQDQTSSARDEITAFVGEDGAYGGRHFILHHARLAVQAGGVEAFLIGSEMVGLTRIRDHEGRFPFVEALLALAEDVRDIVGPAVQVSYAADWTEYGAFAPGDGSGDVLFPLDPLWASDAIDFVGVDWYPPMSDWRDGDAHLDHAVGFEKIEEDAYLLANLEGGEAYDWYYSSDADRAAQTRTPIEDLAHGEPWVFRQKDLANWWLQSHRERPGGVRQSQSTAWAPGSKPIRIIELGIPAIDKGTNAPNLFCDPKSSESAQPHFSNGGRDDLIQRRALAVANAYWRAQPMIEQVLNWAWDGRPWPDYPSREDVWGDGPNWQYGHWLNGRASLIDLSEVVGDISEQAGVLVETRDLDGVVEGAVLDSVMSVARALSPLASAFEFAMKDTGSGLVAAHEGGTVVAEIISENTIAGSSTATRELLDKQPSAVMLQYISGDTSYAPAVVEARVSEAVSDLKVGLTYPLVLSAGRAQILADRRLTDIRASRSRSIALPPTEAIGLEPLDRITLDETEWIVERIEEVGLQRLFRLRPARASAVIARAIEAPSATDPAILAADPVLELIDGPPLEHLDGTAVWAAASGTPWIGAPSLKLGEALDSLSELATVRLPSGIGQLLSPFEPGPLGRWDDGNVIDLYMPGESLSSTGADAVLSGANRVLVKNSSGWELLGWRHAELVSVDRWHLSGLIRGIGGSAVESVPSGTHVVIADYRLTPISLSQENIGRTIYAQIGSGQATSFQYLDRASLPWRVGHLRARWNQGRYLVSWTARGAHYTNNWELADNAAEETFIVELYRNDAMVSRTIQTVSELELEIDTADLVRVATQSTQGRVGEWASIPV